MEIFPVGEVKKVRAGSYGTVYRIDQEHVAKVPHDPSWLPDLEREGGLQARLYDVGISVPKPEGIFSVHIEDEDVCALVMEYIPGIFFPDMLPGAAYEQAKTDCAAELQKAGNLGFTIGHDAWHNAIFTPERKIVLIDFGEWHCRAQA